LASCLKFHSTEHAEALCSNSSADVLLAKEISKIFTSNPYSTILRKSVVNNFSMPGVNKRLLSEIKAYTNFILAAAHKLQYYQRQNRGWFRESDQLQRVLVKYNNRNYQRADKALGSVVITC
jgi:hypothetical protein